MFVGFDPMIESISEMKLNCESVISKSVPDYSVSRIFKISRILNGKKIEIPLVRILGIVQLRRRQIVENIYEMATIAQSRVRVVVFLCTPDAAVFYFLGA